MKSVKKIILAALVAFIVALPAGAHADDAMRNTMSDAVYGGVIGALAGAALMLLTDNPDDHIGYIPTGAAVGILAGAAYGLATNNFTQRAATEIQDGRLTLNMPTVHSAELYDKKTNRTEVINVIDLVRVRF